MQLTEPEIIVAGSNEPAQESGLPPAFEARRERALAGIGKR